MTAKRHARRDAKGRFIRAADGGRTPRKKLRDLIPHVEKRVMEQAAERGKRQYKHDRKGAIARRRTLQHLLAEYDGEVPASAALLAERIARAREQLDWLDNVIRTFRAKGVLVDRTKKQLRPIVKEYAELNAQFRADLVAWSQLRERHTLDELVKEVEELKRTATGVIDA